METYCENCGAKLKEESKFCHKCGNEIKPVIAKTCPKCGESIADSENFCENCGTGLNTPPAAENESLIEKHKLVIIDKSNNTFRIHRYYIKLPNQSSFHYHYRR